MRDRDWFAKRPGQNARQKCQSKAHMQTNTDKFRFRQKIRQLQKIQTTSENSEKSENSEHSDKFRKSEKFRRIQTNSGKIKQIQKNSEKSDKFRKSDKSRKNQTNPDKFRPKFRHILILSDFLNLSESWSEFV